MQRSPGRRGAPVEEVSLKIIRYLERLRVVSYRVMLDVPRELVLFVPGLLAVRRREIGTRKAPASWAVTGRRCSRWPGSATRGTSRGWVPGFGLAQSTAYRYLDEVIGVLAARAPGLREALERALAAGTLHVILDGKVVDADRCREDSQPQGRGHRLVVCVLVLFEHKMLT